MRQGQCLFPSAKYQENQDLDPEVRVEQLRITAAYAVALPSVHVTDPMTHCPFTFPAAICHDTVPRVMVRTALCIHSESIFLALRVVKFRGILFRRGENQFISFSIQCMQ
jgi:hypothetical protein